jgi:hypothetical protein
MSENFSADQFFRKADKGSLLLLHAPYFQCRLEDPLQNPVLATVGWGGTNLTTVKIGCFIYSCCKVLSAGTHFH